MVGLAKEAAVTEARIAALKLKVKRLETLFNVLGTALVQGAMCADMVSSQVVVQELWADAQAELKALQPELAGEQQAATSEQLTAAGQAANE